MRALRLLLRLYPASFRNEYGEEMLAVLLQERRAARGTGVLPFWLRAAAGAIRDGAAAHVDLLKQDSKYAVRVLARTRGFAVTAILIVALGTGATTAAFSVADFVLFRPLPFHEPHRLVKLWESTPGYPTMELSPPNFRDWISAATSYSAAGFYFEDELTLMRGSEPRRVSSATVSDGVFPTLGVAPVVGRMFRPDDDREGAAPTVILSHAFWLKEFGGDAAVLGMTVLLDDTPYTIIGVMPSEFHFPSSRPVLWTTARFGGRRFADTERADNYIYGIARLAPGVSTSAAQAEADVIAAQLRQQFPKENKDTGALVIPVGTDVPHRSRLLLLALLGASGCVLLIACANIANLLLARALSRRRELAVRAAIGAGRERIVRQLLTESAILALTGGVLGVFLAVALVPLIAQLAPAALPLASQPTVDLRVLAFALIVTVATGTAFGLAPIVRVGAAPDVVGLREGPRAGAGRKEHLRAALVVAEIVATVVLLVSTGLLIRALAAVRGTDPGFDPAGVLTLRTELPVPQYAPVAVRNAFYARVLGQVHALPGVTAAGYASFLPMSSFRGGIWPIAVKGDPGAAADTRSENNVASVRFVTPGFFDAMGIPIKRGRDVAEGDVRERQSVAVVSESFVRRYWSGADPIGRQFTFAMAPDVIRAVGGDRQVIGVVGDVKFRGLERVSEPQVYLPAGQVADDAATFYSPRALAIRTTGNPAALIGDVRGIIGQVDPKLAITEVQTLSQLVDEETVTRSVQVRVLAAFAAIAFVLATVGIHGVLAFSVSQRTQEIGVRIALGAQRRDIVSMVTLRSAALAITGIVPGVLLAYAAGRGMEALLAGVKPADTAVLVGAVALAFAMTIAGTLTPALRALRVDPITALRSE